MTIDYALIWAGLIAFAVLAYIVLDGFDLGVGILFPWVKGQDHRDQMMNSVVPVWDGNETWLVLGGGGLFAVFPLAYSIIMPALYAPFIAMLLALVFRGVAFEFRFKSRDHQWFWDLAFAGGSIVAAFAQGVAMGALVQGISVEGRAYAGGWWDWLSPFSLLTGLALVVGYALLGATWLMLKTEGRVAQQASRAARMLGIVLLGLIVVVSVWTPFLHEHFMLKWFAWPEVVLVVPVPLLVAVCALLLYKGLSEEKPLLAFLSVQGLFILSYFGLLISFFPYIVPSAVTIWQAAAPDKSLKFLLVGAVVLLPMILAYTAYAYWVFRGKVGPTHHYHA
ncbi:MAG: cytochrome d ubiquinol oxidase subunit II [Candidatus Methylopumilus sp.]|nr:cytochrome d ubiquinol oxidase subunit II [Candidatus Methylopumilus sp.]